MVNINPITEQDYPDPDVIRVGDTYYLLSTTMHFFPGGSLLRSYDLVHWEPLGHLYETLDETDAEVYRHDTNIYGRGMWAPSLRYHDGTFYALFVSIEMGRTYIFTTQDPAGEWIRHSVDRCYYDASLLFDDDKLFVVQGNTVITVTELDKETFLPKEGGIDQVIYEDKTERILGYEGTHAYKIDGKYLIFNIHWPKGDPCIRTQVVHYADSILGPYKSYELIRDDYGLPGKGVAQGGIVDTPYGKWFGFFFRDSGACGRIPILTPITFKDGLPFVGDGAKIPEDFELPISSKPGYKYESLVTGDFAEPVKDTTKKSGNKICWRLKHQWQFNHCPSKDYISFTKNTYTITTAKVSSNLVQSQNMLTQRTHWTNCSAEVTVDGSLLNDGDYAGLCVLQANYGALAISKETGYYYLNLITRTDEDKVRGRMDVFPGTIVDKVRLSSPKVTIRTVLDYKDLNDVVSFAYKTASRYDVLPFSHKLQFKLDHFCGARFGLFTFSTVKTGGSATFSDFKYKL